jgi:hypothetical protein
VFLFRGIRPISKMRHLRAMYFPVGKAPRWWHEQRPITEVSPSWSLKRALDEAYRGKK